MDSRQLLHSSARVLECDTLRELLRGYSSSPLGRQRIEGLTPSTDRNWIDEQQQLTEEVREFRRAGGRFDFSGLLEIAKLIDKARIAGAALETAEIRDVVLVVDRAAEWREIALHPPASMKSEWCRVRALSERVTDFTEFLRFFRNKIQPDGTLEDCASPELGQGVLHAASSSGQTVFVEPLETIEQNNELVRLLDEELAEIHRILLEMTRRIGESADPILKAADVLAELDVQFAKARFAEEYSCVPAKLYDTRPGMETVSGVEQGFSPADQQLRTSGALAPEGTAPGRMGIILHDARHPLLERNLKAKRGQVIPISIDLEGENLELVI